MNKIQLIIAAAVLMLSAASCGTRTEQSASKDFLDLAKERYSVRKFTDTPVEQEKIDLIIEAGKVAPTAVNSQPQMIYVVKSKEGMEKMNQLSRCIFGAPQAFIFCYNDDTVCKRGEEGNYGEIDVTIVLTHMMLEATNLGIGTCCVGMFDPDELSAAFNIPDTIHPILIMPFGYAADDATPSAMHSQYRPLDETVEYL